jgi:hypothetical protein
MTTYAYVIGANMQKINFVGGCATESSVVLDQIDPSVVPMTVDWHFFVGSRLAWGGQPKTSPPYGDMMA